MNALDVYDPAQCCSSGVCGPDGVDELAQFAATLEWIKQQGIAVSRFNLGHQPEAFVGNAIVKGAITGEGVGCLPLLVIDGRIISKGHYPGRDELAAQLGLSKKPAPVIQVQPAKRCCG